MTQTSEWIDTNDKLQTVCDQLLGLTTLAVDTEFIRTDTFYPKIALIQLSNGQQCWLIDVLAIDQFSPLKALLESPHLTLIFHACAEDLEVLDYGLDIQPRNIFDTQIAAGLINLGYNMGYARLVESFFDIQLDKQETRSNWLARPLSQRQLDYAQIDVIYLHRLHRELSTLLADQKRHKWFNEEMRSLFALVESRKNPTDYYLRIKGAWRLNGQSLRVLNHLCCWRENIARTKDKPRSRIVKDTVLLDIAKQLPTTKQQLFSIEDWYPSSIKRHGDSVLQEIQVGQQQPPLAPLPQPLGKEMTTVMKSIRKALASVAKDQQIPPEFLCNKRELEDILRSSLQGSCRWPSRLTEGWRRLWVKPTIESVLTTANLL
jgi:ribonuclease D